VSADQDVFPVPLDQGAATICSDRVAGEGAERIPEHARKHRTPVAPWRRCERLDEPTRHAPSGERKDQLGWQWDRAAFDGHRDDDTDVAEPLVERFEKGQNDRVERFEHAGMMARGQEGCVNSIGGTHA